MSTLPRSVYVCAALLLLVSPGFGKADELDSAERSAEALKINTGAAKSYTFEVSGDPSHELEFRDESVLRWTNPLAGEVYGSVFVWTHHGRPEVIGSFHQWYSPHTHGAYHFHSLVTSSVLGIRDDGPVWRSEQPGIELSRHPAQQAVAESRIVRLSQMRTISREFTVQKTDREGGSRELRLLPQPVYRYADDNGSTVDGALFVFVQGTRPEVSLLVEARPLADGSAWHYAVARMNSVQFVAEHEDREVWRVGTWPWSKAKNGREPYTIFGPFERPVANE